PLPERYPERTTWALALDPHVSDMKRYKPGPLLELCPEEEREKYRYNPRKMARIGYRRRLITVPGVVCMSTPFLGASLQISAVEVRPPPEILAKVKDLRLKWKAPDGSEIQDAHVAAMRAKEVTRGLWYRLNPYPP